MIIPVKQILAWAEYQIPSLSVIIGFVLFFLFAILLWKNLTYLAWAWITSCWIKISKKPAKVGDIIKMDNQKYLLHKINSVRVYFYRIENRELNTTTITDEIISLPITTFVGMKIVNLGEWI